MGQKEWDLFTKIYGSLYSDFADKKFDDEDKITEFNYEKFIPKAILDGIDTQSDSFKQLIKSVNFLTHTKMEQHKINQNEFKELMPILS